MAIGGISHSKWWIYSEPYQVIYHDAHTNAISMKLCLEVNHFVKSSIR